MSHRHIMRYSILPSLIASIVIGLLATICLAGAGAKLPASNWPGWRGDGSGISSEKGLSVYWSRKDNIAWRVALPDEGNSSPIVWGEKLFLSGATEGGKRRWVLCLSARTGKQLWKTDIAPSRETKTYPITGFAASTPVTDGKRVYAFFDSPGLVALNVSDGKIIWTRDFGPQKAMYNTAASPVLYKNLVIISLDQDSECALAGIDSRTGEVKWRTEKKPQLEWSTPLVIKVGSGAQVISNGPTVYSVDPDTGKVLWTCSGLSPAVTPSAVFSQGVVYATSGRNGPTVAIDPTGSGDITDNHVLMRLATGGPYVPSPVVYPYLLLPGDNGAVRMVDSGGNILAETRIEDHFTASPVAADGHIYWSSEYGTTYVLQVGRDHYGRPTLKQVAANAFKENCMASPAISGNRIYIRTVKALYCIAGHKPAPPTPASQEPVASYEDLEARYKAHPEFEGPDVTERLAVVMELGRSKDPRAIDFLKRIAKTDIHWDVNEEAAKALGKKGAAGIPSLIELLSDQLSFIRVSAAQQLGMLKPVSAVEGLSSACKHTDPQTRIAGLDAITTIARTHRECIDQVVPVLVEAVGDPDSAVRYASVKNIGSLGKLMGTNGKAAFATVTKAAGDTSSLVSRQAKEVLADVYGVGKTPPPARSKKK